MLVEYLGNTPDFIVEFNGKRYMFTNKARVVDIPPEVLRHIYQSGHVNAHEVVPYDDISRNAEVDKLRKENSDLRAELDEFKKVKFEKPVTPKLEEVPVKKRGRKPKDK